MPLSPSSSKRRKSYLPLFRACAPKYYTTSFPHRHFHTLVFLLILTILYLLIYKFIISNNSLTNPLQLRLTLKNTSLSSLSNPSIPQAPLVTVILTAYNVRPFIDLSLNATLSQTYQNLQIIIVDDASTDNTSERIKALSAHDHRVTHIRFAANTFGGVAIPSNIGIEAAKGKYIAFVDGDDLPKPHFIEKMLAIAEKSHADFTYCNFRLFENNTNITKQAYDLNSWPSAQLIKRSQTHPFHPRQYPQSFTLSPVPWRKLYNTDFLIRNNIRFPEGDYFFEDNAFHWSVNIHATKISFLDDVLVLHRTGRKTQTTSSLRPPQSGTTEQQQPVQKHSVVQTPEQHAFVNSLASAHVMKYFPNCNYIGYRIAQCNVTTIGYCRFLRTAFLKWAVRARWILPLVKAGNNAKISAKAVSIHTRFVNYWIGRLDPNLLRGWPEAPRRTTSESIQLSIVVPAYNVEQFLPQFVRLLQELTVRHEVIFVDDNSTDSTINMLKQITDANKNMYVLRTNGSGAGRARNLGLVFCEGQYVVFLDSDDVFRPWVLDSAVWHAIVEDTEVLMLEYKIDYVRRRRNDEEFEIVSSQGMFDADRKLWSQIDTADLEERKALAAKMTNYPWTKLVKRELLVRENIFYGGTVVNNDVQFHWHSIFAARSLEAFPGRALITHRKFEDRKTLTETQGADRLELLDSLVMTNRVLVNNGVADYRLFGEAWQNFSRNLIAWGRARVGSKTVGEYERRSKEVVAIIADKGNRNLLLMPP